MDTEERELELVIRWSGGYVTRHRGTKQQLEREFCLTLP
ncbi:MAG: hypothetical protein QOJ11_3494 [Frankiales bacterium]|jgi:hypothetical protein|nr:hypothetical protein [Frankiales bacterium]